MSCDYCWPGNCTWVREGDFCGSKQTSTKEEIMQKFHKGDLVHVAKDLGPSMFHFEADCDAIVVGSYDDQYGRGDTSSYTLYIKGSGTVSWYHENQLTLIESSRSDLLDKWKNEAADEKALKGDLDWIFSHGKEVLKSAHPASVEALAECADLNLWGPHGEGLTYYQNSLYTLRAAKPFLLAGDKKGWLKFASNTSR